MNQEPQDTPRVRRAKKDPQMRCYPADVKAFAPHSAVDVPLYLSGVQAGFPSPADDHIDRQLDLNEYLVENPAATFFVRACGDSMRDAGIHDGAILVVDRAREPGGRSIVVAVVNGELTVKRVRREGEKMFLLPENPDYPALEITPETDFEIWGVVTGVIRKFRCP
ncbi:MAG: LexA family protein [Desulfonatronovibrionaceae bacterium]